MDTEGRPTTKQKEQEAVIPVYDRLVRMTDVLTASIYGVIHRRAAEDPERKYRGTLQEIAETLNIARQNAAHHIALLKALGLIFDEHDGQRGKPHVYRDMGDFD